MACALELIEESGYSFKEAIMYIYGCNKLGRLSTGFCKRCGWTGNFIENANIEKIFFKILEARIVE